MTASLRDYALEIDVFAEELPSLCEMCFKPLGLPGFERCHVCKIILCPNCDIRGKEPAKPACDMHA